ncbi:MAG: gliding motility protein GldN [Bacteroidales bacterium]|jgi:gliding motility associated protien GldN|nr:gliding motility protein GldN [Bacteroidales bacterium]
MKKQSIFILTILILLSGFGLKLEAQESVIDGAYAREHVPKREMVSYQGIREADAMYSKRVLRMIDLDEKINHPLYFPIRPIDYPGGQQPARSRVSLIHLLYHIGILNPAEAQRQMVFKFDPNDFNNWYKSPIPPEDSINRRQVLTYQEDIQVLDQETGVREWQTVDREIALQDVKSYLLWEEWVFDKQRSVMDVRIIAIAPIAKFITDNNGIEEIETQRLFWVPFPQYRPLLARYEVFNVQNDSERRTFDDLFAQRRFESYLISESNVYDNRFIRDYLLGIDAMHEGKKVEAELFNFEHDLWEY